MSHDSAAGFRAMARASASRTNAALISYSGLILTTAALSSYLALQIGVLLISALTLLCAGIAPLPLFIHARGLRVERERTRRSEEWRRQLLSSVPDLFFETDSAGRFVAVSDACAKLLGVTVDGLLNRPLTDVLLMDQASLRGG